MTANPVDTSELRLLVQKEADALPANALRIDVHHDSVAEVESRLRQTTLSRPDSWIANDRGLALQDVEHIARWLIHRSSIVGAIQAISELEKFDEHPVCEATHVISLYGPPNLPPRTALGETGIEFWKWSEVLGLENIPNNVRSNELQARAAPDAALVHTLTYDAASRDVSWGSYGSAEYGPLFFMLDALSIAIPAHFGIGHYFTCFPSHVPIFQPIGNPSYDRLPPNSFDIANEKMYEAADLYLAIRHLKGWSTGAERRAARRLTRAAAQFDPSDSFIDLGIAMEMILLRKEKGEIRYKFSQRGAWALGKNDDDRLQIAKDLSALYDLRSSAAHGEQIAFDKLSERPFKVGLNYGSRLLMRVLREGLPHWNRLTLGGNWETDG